MSGFSNNELLKSVSNYPIAKGDLPGHPFHGNQYQTGAWSGTSVPTGIHTINGKDVTIAPGAKLFKANLDGANLQNAKLSKANLIGAILWSANLSGAELNHANLINAHLNRADLYRANLSGASLTGADLSNTDLSGANLLHADLSGADLTGARGDKDTKLPSTHEVVNGFVVERK